MFDKVLEVVYFWLLISLHSNKVDRIMDSSLSSFKFGPSSKNINQKMSIRYSI